MITSGSIGGRSPAIPGKSFPQIRPLLQGTGGWCPTGHLTTAHASWLNLLHLRSRAEELQQIQFYQVLPSWLHQARCPLLPIYCLGLQQRKKLSFQLSMLLVPSHGRISCWFTQLSRASQIQAADLQTISSSRPPSNLRDVWENVEVCSVYAQNKTTSSPPAGLLRPLPVPGWSWSQISLEFITGLSTSSDSTACLACPEGILLRKSHCFSSNRWTGTNCLGKFCSISNYLT